MLSRALLAAAVVLFAAGCGGSKGGAAGKGRGGDEGEALPVGAGDDVDAGVVGAGVDAGPGVSGDGATLYASLCASCHGASAEGTGAAPALAGWSRGRDALVSFVDANMPPGNAGACDAGCASLIADWILALTPGSTTTDACAGAAGSALPPQQIRLLTRSELDATVAALFAGVRPSCTSAGDCPAGDDGAEHCGGDGRCHVDACATTTFTYAGHLDGTVALAGDFNGWQPAPMQKTATGWATKLDLADGAHAYKLVLDGSTWIEDPSAAAHAPDGFGGDNSVVDKHCAGAVDPPDEPFAPPVFDYAAAFPVEGRPEHYPFDNAAALGLVTSAAVDAERAAALSVAKRAATDRASLAPCLAQAPVTQDCAQSFVSAFGRRAFRRPLDDDEIARFTQRLLAESDAKDGVARVIASMLLSPQLLYASEVGVVVDGVVDGGHAVLTPYEAASALSYMITGGPPDDVLLDAAANGRLVTGDDRAAQAERLLATPAARARLEDVAVQWLGVEGVLTAAKSAAFPGFTPAVRTAMLDETKHMFSSVVFDGSGSLDDLFATDRTFLDPALATFYGVPSSGGTASVTAPDGRRGVLGLGAVLATYAYPDQTSPPRRGVWLRERLLCQQLGTPPPNAGAIPAVDDSGTTRQRFDQHGQNPQCAACHQYIDGVGFGFEHYDAVGRWRDVDNGQPVDASGSVLGLGTLGDGSSASFDSLDGLAQILVADDRAATCFTTQVYRYAHGKLDDGNDACAVSRLASHFEADHKNIRDLVVDVVRDDSFVDRSTP